MPSARLILRWGAFLSLLALVVSAVVTTARWVIPDPSPVVEMALYHPGEGASEVSPEFTLRLSAQDLRRGYVDLPLALAVRNVGRRGLDAAKLVVRYPKGLNVQASGKLRIDSSNRTIVYEKQLQVVDQSPEYTLIEPVDTLRIRVISVDTAIISLSKDNVPLYFENTFVSLVASRADIPPSNITEEVRQFAVTIVERGGGQIHGVATIRLPSLLRVDLYGWDPGGKTQEVTEEDREIVSALQRTHPVAHPLLGKEQGHAIRYEEHALRGEWFAQLIYLDERLRLAYTDHRGDGSVERTLVDTNGDGRLDTMTVYRRPIRLLHWKRDAFES